MARISNLEGLLAQLDGDPSVKDGVRALLKFGLVFEDSHPEVLRLTGGRAITGCRVDDRSPDVDRFGTVVRAPRGVTLEPGVRPVVWDDTPDEVDYVTESAIVPIAKPGEAVYPGLNVIDTVERGGDRPHHLVIEGENLHALQALRYTHAGKVDVIYIDPPYGTGNDFIYNDRFVAKEDAYRHSKWLSMMERRLRLARELLSPTGVIIVAIDDNEQAHLKLLMDEIFGPQNFIANVVWQGSVKNDARFLGGGVDYMLVYARSRSGLVDRDVRWRARKEGLGEVLAVCDALWHKHAPDNDAATRAFSGWWRSNIDRFDRGLGDNVKIDVDGTPVKAGNISWPGGGGPRFDVLHPVTGMPVKVPSSGWRFTTPERMQEEIDAGRILFGKDHHSGIRTKTRLAEMSERSIAPSFEHDRRASTKALAALLGQKRFDFPKDTNVLARWIGIVTQGNPNAIVLDFFGGSGSTMHAVMEMNANDGGSRQCILVTNNEVEEKQRKALVRDGLFPGDEDFEKHGIFRHVTYPRIKTVATGIREDGSTYSDGLAENVTFAEMVYTTRQSVRLGRDFNTIAPLLWTKAGGRGGILSVDGPDLPDFLVGDAYGVLFDSGAGALADFAVAAEDGGLADGSDVFVVTDDDVRFAHACQRLTNFTVHRLYEDYLSNFEVRA